MAFGAGLTRGAQLLDTSVNRDFAASRGAYRVPDQRCKGLAVRVAPSGVKTWDLAYRIRGTGKMRACRSAERPTSASNRRASGPMNSPARRAVAVT